MLWAGDCIPHVIAGVPLLLANL